MPLPQDIRPVFQDIQDTLVRSDSPWIERSPQDKLKVLSNASGPLLRYEVSGDGANPYDLAAAGAVSFYFNPFTLNGGLKIPVRIHPRVPPGTVIGFAENLPIQYQSNEVPNVAEVKTRQDYYQIDWPVVTRQRQVGVYAEEVLAIYAPFAMGVITNIANG